jgi:Family of unknown function (DUF5681)
MAMTNPKRPGRWKAGESGNPAGRKPGSGEVAKMRAAMAEHVPALVTVLVERALSGDIGAARLLLERTIAPLKASEEAAPLAMPEGTLADQAHAVVQAAADGNLAPGQAAQMVAALGGVARIVETTEILERLTALEAKQVGNT